MSSLFTHVADAITMRPVERSTAITDEVAKADVGRMRKMNSVANVRRCRMTGCYHLGVRRSALGARVRLKPDTTVVGGVGFSRTERRVRQLRLALSPATNSEGVSMRIP